MTGIDSWSTTPATNATADGGSINWAEGQPPSSVNNTARQMLADVRARNNDVIWFQYGTGDQGAGNLAVPSVYSSGTAFTITGADVTLVYHAGRRVRAVGIATGTIYGTISSTSYNGGNSTTTVNVTWDSGSLSNETLVVSLSQAPRTGNPLGGAPTHQILTAGSAATYTTPKGVHYLRIRMLAGGGGGASNSVTASDGSIGGTTSFNGITVIGGGGGNSSGNPSAGGTGGSNTPTGGVVTGLFRANGTGGFTGVNGTASTSANGGAGGASVFGGGVGSGSAAVNSGAGGPGGSIASAAGYSGGGGGAGEYVEFFITNPGTSYTYTIGAAGAAATGGGNGGSGVIIVDEFYI